MQSGEKHPYNLKEIESHIDELDRELDILDPNNPIEAQRIELCAGILSHYIRILESREDTPRLRLVS